jgi:hypothetical protein
MVYGIKFPKCIESITYLQFLYVTPYGYETEIIALTTSI